MLSFIIIFQILCVFLKIAKNWVNGNKKTLDILKIAKKARFVKKIKNNFCLLENQKITKRKIHGRYNMQYNTV